MLKIVFRCLIMAVGYIEAAWADLPLMVEDLITGKGKTTFDASMTYANSQRQSITMGDALIIQVGPTSFITVPEAISENQLNNDTLVGMLGLRHGFTAKSEAYVRASFLDNEQRGNNLTGTFTTHEQRFADAWIGISYRFKKDDETPAILGFVEEALEEQYLKRRHAFKSTLLGLTVYKAIDPIVFSGTVAYRLNRTISDNTVQYKRADWLLISPSMGFAVNDRVTLTTGLQWTSREANRWNDVSQGFRETNTDLVLGVGYGFGRGNTLNVTFKTNASGPSGSEIRVGWLYRIT